MNEARTRVKLLAAIMVALFFGVALYLRVYFPYRLVFSGDWIKFTEVDAYFHMRIVDNLAYNFPHLNSFDPYMLYPHGVSLADNPTFFDYLLAGIIWLTSLGKVSRHTIDVVGVYFPAVLGALTVIPVYFIGKELFNRWAGVISAGLVALLPGEFLGRSILGFTDHHVAETLFSAVVMLFLILAVKAARENQLSFNHVSRRDWVVITKPLIYSLLAGLFLGIYLLTWMGALLFVFIISVYFPVQFIIDHLRRRSADYLCFVGVITFVIALGMLLPASPSKMLLTSLVIAVFVPLALSAVSYLMERQDIKPIFYPVVLLGLGLASLAIFYLINPDLFKGMIGQMSILFAWPVKTTVFEMQPLLLPGGSFTTKIAWGNFAAGSFLSLVSLAILIFFVIKQGEAEKTLFVVWSLVVLAAALSMRRFAYYFVINVALLTGYLSWQLLKFIGFRTSSANPVETPRIVRKGKAKGEKLVITARHIYMAFGVMFIVYLLAFFPKWDNCVVRMAIATASKAGYAPSDGWCESLSWLRENSPEPFGESDFYYQLYEPLPLGERYSYPESAYGVVAWWDYGYWITRIGHRIPTCNPGTGHMGEAFLFAAQDEASANEIMNKYKPGSRYVVVDYAVAMPDKFHAVATLSGSSKEKFYDVYYLLEGGELKSITLFYPEYYRSLVVRLYNFDGREVTRQSPVVISYQERVTRKGQLYKEITSVKSFPSYEEAATFVTSQKSGNYRIVSSDPFTSPLSLQALEHYKLIYGSKGSKMTSSGFMSEVKIFEYVK